MNPTTIIKARPKVNLYLEITGILENGYHTLRTLFYPLPGPCDVLSFTPGQAGSGLALDCSVPELVTDSNLVAKAYKAFGEATGHSPDISVYLEKALPMGAGLGGGSSDAAAMLRYLNADAGEKALGAGDMNRLAAKLGADVPFFLQHGPAWAGGIGDALTATEVDLSEYCLVLLCPGVHVSTPWAYGAWDEYAAGRGQKNQGGLSLTTSGREDKEPLRFRTPWLKNDFEKVVFPAFPGLGKLKEKLLSLGACAALMSGSGSSLFALFKDRSKAAWATGYFESVEVPAHMFDLGSSK